MANIPSQLNRYSEYVNEAAAQTGLPADLIWTVMAVEDGSGNPYEVSSAGAIGLMQVEPSTFNGYNDAGGSITDPRANIIVGSKVLKKYISDFGTGGENTLKGLIAYNRGPSGGRNFIHDNPNDWQDEQYLQLCRDRYRKMFGGSFDAFIGAVGHSKDWSTYGYHGSNPPWYVEGGYGRTVEKPTTTGELWDYWDDEAVFPESRKNWSPFHLRIGDTVLVIPPDFIQVSTTNKRAKMETTLRQKNSIKTGANNMVTQVAMNLWFYGDEQINGFPVDAPESPGASHWMDGLRSLVAQFKRCPFLPVENEFLNYTMGIYALAFNNFSVSTVPGFPGLLSAQVIFFKFETGPLLGLDAEFYDKMIVYPMWRFYYQQMLQEPRHGLSTTYLKPVNLNAVGGNAEKIKFSVLDEHYLESINNLKSVKSEQDMYVNWPLGPGDTDGEYSITGFNASFNNILAPLSLDFVGEPTYQFLGSMDTWFDIQIETMDANVVTAIRLMNEKLIYYSEHYRNRYVSGYIGVTNQLVNMMGCEYAVIDSLNISTTPDFPGLYQISIRLVSYDRTQSHEEKLQGHSAVKESEADWGHLPGQDPEHFFNIIQQEVNAEHWLSSIPLYPDLELPPLKLMNGWQANGKHERGVLELINDWRKQHQLRELPFTKIKGTYGQVFCDPDFYIIYPDLSSYLDGGDDMELLGKGFDDKLKKYTYTTPQSENRKKPSKTYDGSKINKANGSAFLDIQNAAKDLRRYKMTALKGNYMRPSWKYSKGPDGKYNPENYTVDWIESQPTPGTDALVSQQMYDMFRYDRRGTMLRAFPTYCLVIIDEGQWVDARKMWDNYYMYHALIEASVTLDRKNPAHTAQIVLGNVYGSLNYRTRPGYAINKINGQNADNLLGALHDAWRAISPDLRSFESLYHYRLKLLDQGYLQAGARVHFRMGYGSNALDLPTVINGQIAEIDNGDVVTIVVQGDGAELMSRQIQAARDEINTWYVEGTTAHALFMHYMVTRGSWIEQLMFDLTQDKMYALGRASAYGIEHFGYVRQLHDPWSKKGFDGFMHDVSSVIDVLGGWATSGFADPNSHSGWAPGNLDPYDVVKNIYTTNEDYINGQNSPAKNRPDENKTGVGGLLNKILGDKGRTVQTYLQGKTPWDIFKLMERESKDFVAYPVHHNFHSTLFFGKQHYYCKQGWVLTDEKHTDVINSYADFTKPFSQFHFYDAFTDIIHNGIKAVAPAFTNVIPLYSDGVLNVGMPSPTKHPVFADRRIRPELQKTKTINTTLVRRYIWTIFNIDVDWIARQFVNIKNYFTGEINYADGDAMIFGTSVIAEAFKDMYQGSITVIGDPSIKPYDYMWINDSYSQLFGLTEAGIITHTLSLETGFVTDIKPDLVTLPLAPNTEQSGQTAYQSEKFMSIAQMAGVAGALTLHFWRMRNGYDMYKAKRAETLGKKVADLNKADKIGFGRYTLASALRRPINLLKKVPIGALRQFLFKLEARLIPTEARVGMPGWIAIAVETAAFATIAAVWDEVRFWLNNDLHSIQILPLFHKGHPYVAGINGHKNLIPGFQDEFIWGESAVTEEGDLNQTSDSINHSRGSIGGNLKFPVWQSSWDRTNGPADPDGRFGMVNHTESNPYHNGYDFSVPIGTPIHAVADGIVQFTPLDRTGYGNYILINHNDTGATLYAHLSQVNVIEGQHVTAGQLIGLSGTTGSSTGPHLHLGYLVPKPGGTPFSSILQYSQLFEGMDAHHMGGVNFDYADPWQLLKDATPV